MCGSSSGSRSVNQANLEAQRANERMAEMQRREEEARQKRINDSISDINTKFGAFNDDWFKQKQNEYTGYYQPQLDDQYAKAQQETLYQLARQGINNSSAGAKVFGDLAKDYGSQQQAMQGQANNYVQQARSQIEQQRNALVNQATATADPQAAANAATHAVGNLQMVQPSGGYSPLVGMFNAFTGAASTAANNGAFDNVNWPSRQQSTTSGNSARVVQTR